MVRVAFLDHSAALSGAELFLARMLRRTTLIEPVVILFEDGPLRELLERDGIEVRVHPLGKAVTDAPGSGRVGSLARAAVRVPSGLRSLTREIRECDAALVYTNSAKAHVLGIPAGRRLRLPTVMHAHNRMRPDTYGPANLAALHAAALTADRVIANSESTRESLLPRVRARTEVFYCPTDVGDVRPPLRARSGPFEIALVGRVSKWKGQRLAVEALAQLVQSMGRGAAALHIYGAALFPQDLAYDAEVRALAERLEVGDLVNWHGHVEDVSAAMRSHDAVIHTSLVPEPMGQVILEAMAAGRPVVAADQGGPLELVEHERSGLLYRAGDTSALAHAIGRLIGEPALAPVLADGGWAAVQAHGYGLTVPRWEALLDEWSHTAPIREAGRD